VLLPVGTYDVVATRGPLHTLDRFQLEITEGTTKTHAIDLKSVAPEGWLAADLHLHAAPSRDSAVSLTSRVKALACEAIDVAVATDHDAITDYGPTVAALHLDRPYTIAGVEMTTAGTKTWGHFNAFPLSVPRGAVEDGLPPYFNVKPQAMFVAARDLGAKVIQVNHPRLSPIGFFDIAGHDNARSALLEGRDFDAIEVLNGFELEDIDKMRTVAFDVVSLAVVARAHRFAVTGNSDSHALMYQECGYPRTWIHTSSPAEAMETIVKGETLASSGPLVELTVDGSPTGSLLKRGKTASARVRAWAASWVPMETIDIYRDREIATSFKVSKTNDGLRFEGQATIEVKYAQTIFAFAHASQPIPFVLPNPRALSVAVTTPVYIE
jgi:hypothetical protein